jgi:hypothetical protein
MLDGTGLGATDGLERFSVSKDETELRISEQTLLFDVQDRAAR